VPSCHEHGSACHANCATERTRTVVSPETRALGDQLIKIRCVNVWISMGGNRVRTLIIREEKDDVGASIFRLGTGSSEEKDRRTSDGEPQ